MAGPGFACVAAPDGRWRQQTFMVPFTAFKGQNSLLA